MGNESWDMLGCEGSTCWGRPHFEGADKLGQPLLRHCDAIGLLIHPSEDAATELGRNQKMAARSGEKVTWGVSLEQNVKNFKITTSSD